MYTPAFVVNGRSWRPGVRSRDPGADTMPIGNLVVRLAGHRLRASFTPVMDLHSPLVLHVAVLGMGLRSQVQAGENAGRDLHHQFVVLAQTEASQAKRGEGGWQMDLPEVDMPGVDRRALVAWISAPEDPTPLQATGGYIE